jgi:uncharacterized membrane protein
MKTHFKHWRIIALVNVIVGCVAIIITICEGGEVYLLVYGVLGWYGLWRLLIWIQRVDAIED